MVYKFDLLKLSALLLFLVPVQAYSQRGAIRGRILNAQTNEPLIGASVLVEEIANGAAADLDGSYVIRNVGAGTYTLVASYVAHQSETKTGIVVGGSSEVTVDFLLNEEDIGLQEVEVVARANRESENILLMEQRQALVATQAVGARELSRKGIGDAQAAVAQVSGISRQEGVKNVFVRGLGDRYNATLLNGFAIPSEDPEYKNIALAFFGSGIIRNIGVSKVFSGSGYSDVGGAVIDITSKELTGDYALALDLSGGFNTTVAGIDFLRQDGSGYFGFSDAGRPAGDRYDFPNSLDPKVVSLPLNHSYGISGGKRMLLGERRNPLSFFVVASHSAEYSCTKEIVRNTITSGLIYQDQKGKRYSQNTNQLALGNVSFAINRRHTLQYNFMIVHANNRYVGEYTGKHGERHQDSDDYMGFHRRQQTNDNLLMVNQLDSDWGLSDKLELKAGVSHNTVKGVEPDRRENYLSRMADGSYILTGSDRQKRFFSTLKGNDFNAKASLTYKPGDTDSSVRLGYAGRFVSDGFEAVEYNFSAVPGAVSLENLALDDLYNQQNMAGGLFGMTVSPPNTYHVAKNVHSGFVEIAYRLLKNLAGNAGLRVDGVDMEVAYRVPHVSPGKAQLKRNYFLPSVNMKYDASGKSALRLGLSKTYTLPQSKEISPYQYVNIGFASQGNPDIKPSDNYNIDLKWDYYITPSELLSLTVFYKLIQNPIGRADQGNSAGLLEYTNISDKANVAGVEVEARKNIFSHAGASSRLSVGFNASYIYTNLVVKLLNTPRRDAQLEGAAPFTGNFDISHTFARGQKSFINSLVFNFFSDRVHTIGSRGFRDILEKGVPTLDFVSSAKLGRNTVLKLKAANLLNPSYVLTRQASESGERVVLNEFKKGQNISLGISYEL
jgi:outer membrane receptor protein involved in Fe transport